ncbi:MAG: Maf family protein [Cytophagaceae bacterium]|jgi:septum formation protein|nr:Maf family protein [Cytophagaceae bacterium]
MFPNLKNQTLILASQSPRRQELLQMMDIDFKVEIIGGIDENYPKEMAVADIPLYIARKKQNAYTEFWSKPNHIVIVADTVVALDGYILGKPCNYADACKMLLQLSGKTHTVITGVSIKSKIKKVEFSTQTLVSFKNITRKMIEYYVEKYRPYDKAGAYGIQEWIGLAGISKIDGSYFNVMGLPADELYDQLNVF